MRQVAGTRTIAEAYLLKDALFAGGIAAVVRGEHLQSDPTPELQPSLWVDDADVGRAIEVLRRSRAGAGAEGALEDLAAPEVPAAARPAEHRSMSDLFDIADRLRRSPLHGNLHDELRALEPAVRDTAPPFGLPEPVWREVLGMVATLMDHMGANDEDHVAETARLLRDRLRDYV